MTTGRGARATNAGKCFSENAVGVQTDLVIVINDLRNFGLTPLNNAILNPDFRELGYSMKALLVDGMVIYKDGRYNAGDANTAVTKALRMRKNETTLHTEFIGLARNLLVSWRERNCQ